MKTCSSAEASARPPTRRAGTPATGVLVAGVARRTPAAAAGLRAGDRILAINGQTLRDAIDFQFHAADDVLELAIERDGALRAHRLRRHGSELGVELEPPRPGEISTCANKCVFCFIHQLPKGMRKSLYVKDDDFRLSFLHGNYITLTDLDEAAFTRIVEQRLSPLYISVHTTDPVLRHRLLGSPRLPTEILPRLERLAKAGIRMHAQIVLCPDWNDGEHLARTVFELAPLHPHVATTAIVPVGLTGHRERLPALRGLTWREAGVLVATVHGWQETFLARVGSRFVFLADEVYLLAGEPLPRTDAYEGFPVVEDGIGLVRRFEDDFARALARQRRRQVSAPVTVVTGEMFAPRLERLLASAHLTGAPLRVVAVRNEFFGGAIAVAGLLTGRDIQNHVAALRDPGDLVLVPAVALRDVDGVFLDDLTPGDLTRDLGVTVRAIAAEPRALLRALVD
jgi:putative radical SAM enzyme (TIGR03279 family)